MFMALHWPFICGERWVTEGCEVREWQSPTLPWGSARERHATHGAGLQVEAHELMAVILNVLQSFVFQLRERRTGEVEPARGQGPAPQ